MDQTANELCRRIMSRPYRQPEGASYESPEQKRVASLEKSVLDAIGDRYRDCTLENYLIGNDRYRALRLAVKENCAKIQASICDFVRRGRNLIFCGPPGTGKDHLMVALLKSAIVESHHTVRWCNGQRLFSEFRDLFDSKQSEESFIGGYSRPGVLAISDPAPPKGEVREHAAHMLYQIVDERYRRNQGVWMTINVINVSEARTVLGEPICSRLMHNAEVVFCNWPDFRMGGVT